MAKKELDRFEKNPKRNMQIKTKLITLIMGSIILCVFGTLFFTLSTFYKQIYNDSKIQIEHTMSGVESMLQTNLKILVIGVDSLTANEELRDSIQNEDSGKLQAILDSKVKKMGISFAAITNTKGTVIRGGGINISEGTNLKGNIVVDQGLSGVSANGFEPIDKFQYAMIAAYPIKIGTQSLGCAVVGFDMSDSTFVNLIKSSYSTECTVFSNDVRVSTTLGDNMIGTKLTSETVYTTVLTERGTFDGMTKINGKPFYAVYKPLLSGRSVTGMIFVAKGLSVIQHTRNHTLLLVLPVILIVMLIIVILSYRFIQWLMWRILNVTKFLTEMETGEADLTKRCKLFIRDEIGDLIIHFDFFLDKLQSIVKELKDTKDELSTSGLSMTSSADETSSAITQIVANIDSINSRIQDQGESVNQTSNAVDDIANSIVRLDNMIEDQSAGIAEASSAIEEMIGNIASVSSSMAKMAESFGMLEQNARAGVSKQSIMNERVVQIGNQSELLLEANAAISSIAEQTNLLAMNAAIEAAHAGEAGKGFSVVADEIRKLSETSSAQSKTIGDQLNEMKNSIADVVAASTESSESFNSVSNKIKETDQLVSQIRNAMEEQNEGSKQISGALKDMNDSTSEVQRASKDMSAKNSVILKEIKLLRDATASIKNTMDEMSIGATRIGESGAALTGISGNVKSAIQKIGTQVDLFTV